MAKMEELGDSTQPEHNADDESSPEDGETNPQEEQAFTASQTSQSHKKKKKSKASRALNALRGKEIPQEIVDSVLEKVKAEGEATGSPIASGADAESVRSALEQLKILDVLKGNTGIAGKNKKEMGEHKFWATQPVPQLGEVPSEADGFIEPSKPPEEVRQEPYPLPSTFEWTVVDITDPGQIKEVYDLLSLNYVEDDDASFRFKYSAEFLEWALKVPGYHKEWHIGVRVAANKKLVAFISGVPVTLRVRGNVFRASEINYLCVHKKLRSKRLAPVLIKEVTRQCHLKGIFQAIYTAGVVLPTPVATCRYYHRSLNVPKLVEVDFTPIPRNQTMARMIRLNKLPAITTLDGLREMQEGDISQVTDLFNRYMQRFDLAPTVTEEEVRHTFLSGLGKGTVKDGRREGQVIWSYVIENPETHKITDYFSFYTLSSTIINNKKHNLLEAVYLFYYATEIAFEAGVETNGRLRKRVHELIADALVVADQAKFDVFNVMTLMDNVPVLTDLKFGAGDGLLNFYLYNWRTAALAGVRDLDGVPAGRGVGVVML